jgi:endonuclease/exonuclease/phosphatase family metal-dependent hydrolase
LDTPADGVNQWTYRKQRVAELLERQAPDIFGVQEALANQMDDLSQLLPAYRWYGVGRDDAKREGEFSAIFYRPERMELLRSGTFWLSETPAVPGSRSWDAAITRICSWGMFRDRSAGRTFYVFNTHFDHRGELARLRSLELIRSEAVRLSDGQPYILMGDFNFEPAAAPYGLVGKSKGWDIRDTYAERFAQGEEPGCTFTGFRVEGAECRRIDHVFVSAGWAVSSFEIDRTNDGTNFPSDHLPVRVDLRLVGR